MAVAAARDALARSGHRAEDIALLLHACVYFQGLELYPTASYIHREVLGDHSALAFEIKNASNGCMTALDIAARSSRHRRRGGPGDHRRQGRPTGDRPLEQRHRHRPGRRRVGDGPQQEVRVRPGAEHLHGVRSDP
ncbi:hypothetical protein ACFQ60_00410 [Streptomyces zhihengii]